jgi:hypothetical protein
MFDLERKELDWADRMLLRSHYLAPASATAREIVLVGRLQRALGMLGLSDVDGIYGSRTHAALHAKELQLGPELAAIVSRWRTGWAWDAKRGV